MLPLAPLQLLDIDHDQFSITILAFMSFHQQYSLFCALFNQGVDVCYDSEFFIFYFFYFDFMPFCVSSGFSVCPLTLFTYVFVPLCSPRYLTCM